MKTITKEELNERIRLHGLWLAKDPNGVKLDLSYHDLSHTSFEGKNIRSAKLRGSYLYGAYFRFSNLREADFRDTYLRFSTIRDANIVDTNFCRSTGNGKEVKTLQTLEWHVNIIKPTKTIWIGSNVFSFEDFLYLGESGANRVQNRFWDWVKIWRPTIRKMAKEGVK